VDGKVFNSVTGEPVKKAVVTMRNPTGQYSYFGPTDAFGKFHFDGVQPEKYTATADAEGYIGNRALGLKPFTVSPGQQWSGLEIRIAPLSVIDGKVTDEDGEPLDGVSVMALRYIYNTGTKTLQSFASAQTDDRGRYRIFDLQPGRYYLVAHRQNVPLAPQNSERVHSTVPAEGFGTVIYPGVADISQAAAHELKPGAEWTGADFKLRKLPAYHIRARIDGLTGSGGNPPMLQVTSCNSSASPMAIGFQPAIRRLDGSFDIAGAVPGTYCLTAIEPGRGGIAARRTVTVKDADVNDVTLTAEPAFSVKGSVTIEGTPLPGTPTLGVGLRSADGNRQMHALVAGDFTFQIDNIFPGQQIIMPPAGQQLYVKSMLYAGQDVSNGIIPNAQPGASLAIAMGTDPGGVDGTVQLGSLESGTPVSIAIVPDDARAARTDLRQFTGSSAEGAFTFRWLAPGDYKIFALETPDFEDTQNNDLLQLLEGKATTVTIHAGGHEQVSVIPIAAGDIQKAKEKLP
jgi:protocatechuate 3,4-dioxygenase beta subunit